MVALAHPVSCVIRFLALVVLVESISSLDIHAQKISSTTRPGESFTFLISTGDTSYHLPHQFLKEQSETVFFDSLILLQKDVDYSIDYRRGVLKLSSRILSGLVSDPSGTAHRLTVHYERYPFSFRDSYFLRELVVRRDTARADTIRISKPASSLTVDDIFGANLQKSGSLFRGLSVGSNRDLALSSGFRMQLAGKIARDIEVIAALTDENTPIQPEGNTQTLQEIDKVSIEIRSPTLSATIGDFLFSTDGTEFGRLNRKLQGARGIADYRLGGSRGNSVILGAVTRGKFHTNQFQGIEGVQGPYRLSGRNGERNIIIIAGTERVYVDGEKMTRGETNDYIIDYSSGEITFRPRRLITSASRIVVDFEYTDRFYSRSLLIARTESELVSQKVKVTGSFFRESDNENGPIDISLSDSDRAILRQSGNDRLKATKPGASFVGRDTATGLGRGQYVRIDTLVNGSPYTLYRYAPGDTNAVYSVVFSLSSPGDYIRESIGNFKWVGPGKGNYLPIIFLPFAEKHDLADVGFSAQVANFLNLTGEYAFSNFDANKFSGLDDTENKGSAVKFGVSANPRDVKLGGKRLGSFELELKERYIGRRFVPIDRTNDIEFGRKWNLERTIQENEEIREGRLLYIPLEAVHIGGGVGRIARGDIFRSVRREGLLSLQDPNLPRLEYSLESISSRDRIPAANLSNLSSDWLRQRGLAEYAFRGVISGLQYQGEKKETKSGADGLLVAGSFRYDEFAPKLEVPEFRGMSFRTEFQLRMEDSLAEGTLQRSFRSISHGYHWRLKRWKSLSSTVDLTVRNTKFTPIFKRRGNTDIQTILFRSQSRASPLQRALEADLFYEVGTQRASKLERVFLRVPKGTGSYRYLGDLNSNGLAEENEFELTRFDGDFVVVTVPSEALFPVIDVKASTRFRFTPERLIQKPTSFFAKAVSSLSSETYLRVEEKSTEKDLKQIYLLHLSKFQNDSTTIMGSKQITQDLYIFENDPDLSFRFRFGQRSAFTQFALANERTLAIERSMRIRWRLMREVAAQFDILRKVDRLSATRRSSRERNITSSSLVSDFSYRPEQNVEVGLRIEVSRSTDSFPSRPITADLNSEALRCVISLQSRGQFRAEVQREEVALSGAPAVFPFELTGGRAIGKSWIWRLNLDYRITNFFQATVGYDGRSEGSRRAIHLARAEARAFF